MKLFLVSLIIISSIQYYAIGQNSLSKNGCSDLIYRTVRARISGDNSDSTIKSGNVRSGFKLSISDSSYKIQQFYIVFEYGEDLVELPSNGDKLIRTIYILENTLIK